MPNISSIESLPSLISAWDFSEPKGSPRRGRGPRACDLFEGGGQVERVDGGMWSPYSALFDGSSWLQATPEQAPQLNLRQEVTVITWIWRDSQERGECEAVAGRWLETGRERQYCLFLNLGIHNSSQQAALHVSAIGGPTPGERFCMEAAIGATPVPRSSWQCVVGTFAHGEARLYLNGALDSRERFNPYAYAGPLHASTADFTVGAVHRGGVMGNWFRGRLGGLAVCSRALDPETIGKISRAE